MSTAALTPAVPGTADPNLVAPMPGAAGAPRLRITRRGRLVLAAVIAVPLGAAAYGFVSTGSAVATDAPTSSRYDYVQVGSGQSLWELATAIAPEEDPREVVSDILHLNQLASGDLQPGQSLAVPHQYSR